MRKLNSAGMMNPLLPILIVVLMLFLGSLGFGGWAFMERQTYKDDYQSKLDDALAAKLSDLTAEAQKQFDEQEKEPFKTYAGPAEYGNLKVTYPKTWVAYIDEYPPNNKTAIAGFFFTGFVPGFDTLGKTTKHALYLGVNDTPLSNSLNEYANDIKSGKATSAPYAAPQVPDVIGARISRGDEIIVLLPIRDKTLIVQAESKDYWADFDNIIMANLTFQP